VTASVRALPGSRYAENRPTGWPGIIRILICATAFVLLVSQSQYLSGDAAVDAARWTMLGLLGAMLLFRPPKRVLMRRPGLVDACFVAFATMAFASAIYTSSLPVTIQRAASVVLLYVAVFWTLWYYADLIGEDKLVDTLIFIAFAVFALGALSYFFSATALMAGRFRGVMQNPNAVGMLTVIFLPLVIGRFIRKRRLLDAALIGLMILSVVLSGSRNGVITASLSIMFLLWRTRAWKAAFFLAVSAAALLLAMPETNAMEELESRPELSRIVKGSQKGLTSGRAEAWQVAIPIIQRRLLLGYGFGTEDRIFEGISFRVHRGTYVHNSYLGMTYQLGLVGSILLFLPLLVLLFRRTFASRTESVQVAAYEAVLFGGLVASLFESWVYSVGNAFAFPFWICVMLLIRGTGKTSHPVLPAASASVRVAHAPYPRLTPSHQSLSTTAGRNSRRFDPPPAGYQ
jgi:O-antigen ligase